MAKYDYEKVKQACRLLIEGIGDDPNREGLLETPDRYAKMMQVLLGGYDESTEQYAKVFTAESQDMVTVSNIPIFSFCEHHIMPFIGKISIAYIPKDKIIGLSKLARIARSHCKKLQVQERLVKAIADDIEKLLNPIGVAVQVRATHTCMTLRGVRSQGAITTTTAVRGLFKDDIKAREEFLQTIKADNEVYNY